MKFTIGTVSDYRDFSELSTLIKCSLLYADDIELIGIAEYAVYTYLPRALTSANRLDGILNDMLFFLKSLNMPKAADYVQQIEIIQSRLASFAPILYKSKRRTPSELKAQIKLKSVERDIREELRGAIEQLVSHPIAKQIQELVDQNIVTVFDYGFKGFDTDELTGGYFGSLLKTVYTGNSYPLFDNTSKGIIGSAVKSHLVDIHSMKPEVLRHAGVATSILMTLPTLDNASFDELLALKNENLDSLSKYRKAVYGFSDKIAALPWDDDFSFECLKLYNTEVAPQVAEINELLTDTSVLKNLGKRVLADEELRKKTAFMIGGLTSAITASTQFTAAIRGIVTAMSISALSAEAASAFLKTLDLYQKSHDEIKEKKVQAKKNLMYYYHLASKL